MKISGKTRRTDSMMIDANIKKLSHPELIYTYVADLVIRLKRESVKRIRKACTTMRTPMTSTRISTMQGTPIMQKSACSY